MEGPVSRAGPSEEERGTDYAQSQQQGESQCDTEGHKEQGERGRRGGGEEGSGGQDCEVDWRGPEIGAVGGVCCGAEVAPGVRKLAECQNRTQRKQGTHR